MHMGQYKEQNYLVLLIIMVLIVEQNSRLRTKGQNSVTSLSLFVYVPRSIVVFLTLHWVDSSDGKPGLSIIIITGSSVSNL